jgi:hypothetical protein
MRQMTILSWVVLEVLLFMRPRYRSGQIGRVSYGVQHRLIWKRPVGGSDWVARELLSKATE